MERFFNVPEHTEDDIQSVVGKIQQGARECVSPTAVAIPFGSTVNGFGAQGSDLDVLIAVDDDELDYYMSYVYWSIGLASTHTPAPQDEPPAPEAVSSHKKRLRAMANAVFQLADHFPRLGFEVTRSLPRSRRPLITCVNKTGPITEFDISINNRLPLGNTELLRSYAKLDVRLRPFVLLIKTWAKNRKVCGADKGNLSSYAWAIMVIYYFQLATDLPSLQMLKREDRNISDIDYWGYQKTFDSSFLPADVYLEENGGPRGTAADGKTVSEDPPIEALLHGFFRFFSDEYAWGDEVVSMRCPDRRKPDIWWLLYGRAHKEPVIHVEDPIEVRDLNIVMREDRLAGLKEEFTLAARRISEGASLDELLEEAPDAPYVPEFRNKRKRRTFKQRRNLREMR